MSIQNISCRIPRVIEQKPYGYWNNVANVKQLLDCVKISLDIKSPEDWNKISQKEIKRLGGGALLNSYSLNDLRIIGCSELQSSKKYLLKQNKSKSKGYWNDKNNLKSFFDTLKNKYNLNTVDDWDLLTTKQIQLSNGKTLLNKYSLNEIKQLACPELTLKYKNKTETIYKSYGYWNNMENIKKYLSDLGEKYNLNSIDDWMKLTQKQIKQTNGHSLLSKYSIYDIKCIACPEIKSLYPKNKHLIKRSKGYWDNHENVQLFFKDLQSKLNFHSIDDWNRISINQIKSFGGSGLFSKYSLFDLLNIAFPNKNWKKNELIKLDKRSNQRWLFLQIKQLFPKDEIVEDYFHEKISRVSGFPLQFDIFILNKNIAFEYHGKQHYEDIPSAFANLELYKQRDCEKEILCKKYNIKLIIIPYWWDNQLHSLQNLIQNALHSKI